MSRRYTAKDMRAAAKSFACSEVSLTYDKRDIANMLRQAADMMEHESDVVQCRRCQTARSGEGYGDTPPPIGEDDICDRCEIAKRIRGNEEVKE